MISDIVLLINFEYQLKRDHLAELERQITRRYPGISILKEASDYIVINYADPVKLQIELCKMFGFDRISICRVWDMDDDKRLMEFSRAILRKGDTIELAIRPLSGFVENVTDIYYKLSSKLLSELRWLRFDENNASRVIQLYMDKTKVYGELYGCLAGGGAVYGSMGSAIMVFLGDLETYTAAIRGIKAGFSIALLHPYSNATHLRAAVFKAWQLARKVVVGQIEFNLITRKGTGINGNDDINTSTIIDAVKITAKKNNSAIVIYGGTVQELASYRRLLMNLIKHDMILVAPNISHSTRDLYDQLRLDEDYKKLALHNDWANISGEIVEWRSHSLFIKSTETGWHQALDELSRRIKINQQP